MTGRPVLRGIGAIVLSFVVVSALSFGVDGVLHATGIFPPWGRGMAGHLFLLALCYRIVATTRQGPQFGPLWYPIALTASVPLTTWVGGRLGIRSSP